MKSGARCLLSRVTDPGDMALLALNLLKRSKGEKVRHRLGPRFLRVGSSGSPMVGTGITEDCQGQGFWNRQVAW